MNRSASEGTLFEDLTGAKGKCQIIAVGSGLRRIDNSIDIFTDLGILVSGYKPIFIFVFTKSKIEQELCHLVRKRALS